MNAKKLLMLIVLAGGLTGLAVLSSRDKPSAARSLVGRDVLPDFDANNVEQILVETAGKSLRVAKIDGTWCVPDRHNYPVDFDKLKEALLALEELSISEALTLSDSQVGQLNLVSPKEGGKQPGGTLVTLMDGAGKTVGSLLLGKHHETKPPANQPAGPAAMMGGMGAYPDGRYLLVDDNPVRVSKTLDAWDTDAKKWMDDDLVNVSAYDTTQVSVSSKDREFVRLARENGDGDWVLEGMPEDKEIDSSKLNRLAGALSYLRFNDVADPSLTADTTGLDTPIIYEAVKKNGQVYMAEIGGTPDGDTGRYARFRVSFDPDRRKAEDDELINEDDDEAAKATKQAAKQKKVDELAAETQTLNDRLSKWVYILDSYKSESLLVQRAELLKDKEVAEDTDGAETTNDEGADE